MADQAPNPALAKIKFSASVGTPQITPGIAEVTIPVTLTCPAGQAQATDRPFLQLRRASGTGAPIGIVALQESGQDPVTSQEDVPLVAQLKNNGLEGGSNIWFFDVIMAPSPPKFTF